MGSPRKKKIPRRLNRRKPWSAALGDKRGRSFNGQFQIAIYSVHQYFEEERRIGQPLFALDDVCLRTAEALGISRNRVSYYVNRVRSGAPVTTPGKKRARKRVKRDVDDSVKDEVRNVIYEFAENRVSATLKDVFNKLRERNINFCGQRETFRRVLHDIGFTYKIRDGARYLLETPYVVAARKKFLETMKKHFDEDKMTIVYQDETWTFLKGTGKTRDWSNKDPRSNSIRASSCGSRFIICHAGSKNGFVKNASMFFRSDKKSKASDDYHGDMNATLFTKWFKQRLIHNLPDPTVIVFDKATYHSQHLFRQPTTSWKKSKLCAWLEKRRIEHSWSMTNKKLLALCKKHKEPVKFVIDDFVANHTHHKIVRLPPHHPFYSAIELIWGLVKRYYDKHIGRLHKFTEKQSIELWEEALTVAAPPEVWERCCEKIKRRILDDYQREVADVKADEQSEAIIIDGRHLFNLREGMALLDDLDESDDDKFSSTEFLPKRTDPPSARKLSFGGVSAEKGIPDNSENDDLATPLANEEDIPNSTENNPSVSASRGSSRVETDNASFNIPGFRCNEDWQWKNSSQSTEADSGIGQFRESFSTREDSSPTVEYWLSQHDDTPITTGIEPLKVRDLKTLSGTGWLNDVIVNIYMKLIENRSGGSLHAYPSFFFNELVKTHGRITSWTKKIDIFSKEIIFIPINQRAHWTLCVVHLKKQRISYYDSMGTTRDICKPFMQKILHYLQYELYTKKHQILNISKWSLENVEDIPYQDNGSDCGVFMCTYAEYIARKASFDFTARDIANIRGRMMEEIVSFKLKFLNPDGNQNTKSSRDIPEPATKRIHALGQLSRKHEQKTRHAEVYLSVSASFHQDDTRSSQFSRNRQCTANAMICIAALTAGLRTITENLFNDILMWGNQYYIDCRLNQKQDNIYLDVYEDLLTSFILFNHPMKVVIDQCGEGRFQDDFLSGVTDRINTYIEIYKEDLNHCGFLFLASAKTVAFFILPPVSGSKNHQFFLFNSHCVDINNDIAVVRHEGKARLFRCDSAVALARLLLLGQHREKNENITRNWQIYRVSSL